MSSLQQQYEKLHQNEKRFPGYSVGAYTGSIAALIERHSASSLLDYGSGKGYQYLVRRVHEKWGGLLPYCYDFGVRQLSTKPDRTFDGVICTDVLEHIEKADIPAVLDEIIGFADLFIFLGISCRPTRKKLPDGRDVHVTIEHPDWWKVQIAAAVSRSGKGIEYLASFDVKGHFEVEDHEFGNVAG